MSLSQVGQCRSCGVNLIDWQRVHSRDLSDVAFTFQALKKELVRHHFWHVPIDEDARLHARRKGRIGLRVAAERRLRSSVGSADPWHDGAQTPFKGNILYYAQHAVACCCRTCAQMWHGIQKGKALSPGQIEYFVELIMMYINERLPELTDEGEMIPRRRHKVGGA